MRRLYCRHWALANSDRYPPPNRLSNRVHYDWITTEFALPQSSLSDLPSFRREWAVLLECASPTFDSQRLVELARSADWSKLLVLAEAHSVLAHLAVRVRGLDEDLVPAEIRQTLLEHHREQVFSTLRMTAELFRLLELFAAKEFPCSSSKDLYLPCRPMAISPCAATAISTSLSASETSAAPRNPCWLQVTRRPFPLAPLMPAKFPGSIFFPRPTRS